MNNPFVFESIPLSGESSCGCQGKTANQEMIAEELEEEYRRPRSAMRPAFPRVPMRARRLWPRLRRRRYIPIRPIPIRPIPIPAVPTTWTAPPLAIVPEPFPAAAEPDGAAPAPEPEPEPAATMPEPAVTTGEPDTTTPEPAEEFEWEVRRPLRRPARPPVRRPPARPSPVSGATGGFAAAPAPVGSARTAGPGCDRPLLRGACLDQFDFGKFAIKDIHRQRIRALAQCIVASQGTCSPIVTVALVGHTDPVGSLAVNEKLGRQRAESVRNELRDAIKGLRPGLETQILFNVLSRGETDPVDLNDRARDRRVEVFLHNTITDPSGCIPHKARLRMHIKIFQEPCIPITIMISNMKRLYGLAGFLVEVASTERLKGLPNLDSNDAIDVGDCVVGTVTAEQNLLFNNRNNVKTNEIVVYFVRATSPRNFNGCATHPPGRAGVIVTSTASEWTLAHEVGHVLGLNHPDQDAAAARLLLDRLMTSGGTANITGVPRLLPCEIRSMDTSALTVDC